MILESRLSRLLICLFILALFPLLPVHGDDGNSVLESFEIEQDAGLLFAPLRIGERTYPFVIDTGSGVSVFDLTLKEHLTATGQQIQVNEKDTCPVFQCSAATIGKTNLPFRGRVICTDLSPLSDAYGASIYGILGVEALLTHVLQIDFDNRRVSFLRHDADIEGEKIPIKRWHGVTTLYVELPTGRTSFIVDTGDCDFSSGRISPITFDELAEMGAIKKLPETHRRITINGVTEGRVGVLQMQSVGKFDHIDQIYTEGQYNVLGIGYLARYQITIDFPHMLICMKEGSRFGRQSPISRAGIDIGGVDGETLVYDVDIHGNAANAGIKAGDRLIAINGQNVRAMTHYSIGSVFDQRSEGTEVIVLRQDEKGVRCLRLDGKGGLNKTR